MQIGPGRLIAVLVAVSMGSILVACAVPGPTPEGTSQELPPVDTGFDYQLSGGYPPAEDVGIVARDRTDSPAPDVYSICYLNAFQTQPGELSEWPDEAVLTDGSGMPVQDPDWPDEALLDISSPAGQDLVAERLGDWIRGCAADGFDAVEFDNLDSFTRSGGALSASDALTLATRLVEIAHAEGLAAGQKNAAEYAEMFHDEGGFDFAISEECAAYDECASYTDVYAAAVLNVEYTDALPRGFAQVCADPQTPSATILRDRELTTPNDQAYVRESC